MKKLAKILGNIIFIVFVVGAFSLLIGSLFGINPYIVLSGSMEPSIKTGSLCFIDTNIKYDDIKVGDIIAYKKGSDMITHRVVSIAQDGMVTKGDSNDVSDGLSVNDSNYFGKTQFSIPYLGYIVEFIQVHKGTILRVLISMMAILLALTIVDIHYSRKEKNKDTK